jgi:hypothetical protein
MSHPFVLPKNYANFFWSRIYELLNTARYIADYCSALALSVSAEHLELNFISRNKPFSCYPGLMYIKKDRSWIINFGHASFFLKMQTDSSGRKLWLLIDWTEDYLVQGLHK